MLDFIDIKMCMEHMERKNLFKEEFYSGGCNCLMLRKVHKDDTSYNLMVFSKLSHDFHPIMFFNKSEVINGNL